MILLGSSMKFLDIFKSNLIHGGFFCRVQSYVLGRPDIATSGGWAAWEEKTKKDHPIKWFFFGSIPDFIEFILWWPLSRWCYNIKCKYWSKRHHIKIDVDRFFVGAEYSHNHPLENYTWIDSDTKILYATFQILVDFVERESNIIDWSSDPKHQEAEKEFMELYKWWTEERPKRVDDYPSMSDYGMKGDICQIDHSSPEYKRWDAAHDEYNKKEAEYENEDTEMLIRLVVSRKVLWS